MKMKTLQEVLTFFYEKWKTKVKGFSKNNKNIDKNLIIGASMFGAGWGLVGLCPGPAFSAISLLNINVYLFVLFMIVGFYLGKLFQAKK